jgi:hypothetical protein
VNITWVVLKTGEERMGTIGEYRPKEGYFSLIDSPEKIYFRDCVKVIEKNVRKNKRCVKDVNWLQRAHFDGWDGT